MAKANLEVYKCSVCGNVVEVVHAGGGTLVCCRKPMDLLTENTTDAAQEKHVPVVEQTPDGVKVTVGAVAHPMADDHLIEWIQLIVDGRSCRLFLSSGDAPEALFPIQAENPTARAFCNLHGLWKS